MQTLFFACISRDGSLQGNLQQKEPHSTCSSLNRSFKHQIPLQYRHLIPANICTGSIYLSNPLLVNIVFIWDLIQSSPINTHFVPDAKQGTLKTYKVTGTGLGRCSCWGILGIPAGSQSDNPASHLGSSPHQCDDLGWLLHVSEVSASQSHWEETTSLLGWKHLAPMLASCPVSLSCSKLISYTHTHTHFCFVLLFFLFY